MVRVARRDHGPGAGAGHQRPAVVGLEPVVVAAQAVELAEDSLMGLGPRRPVVDLGVGPELFAALPAARRLHPHEGDLLGRRRTTTEVDHGGDVPAAGDHQVDDRVPEQIPSDPDGNGSDARDLTPFIVLGGASGQSFHVDA